MGSWIFYYFTFFTAADNQRDVGYFPVDGGIFLIQMMGSQHDTVVGSVDHQGIWHFLIDDF